MRNALELADIFREHGPAWRDANRGHVSLDQLKVMSAIERCRTAALEGVRTHWLQAARSACCPDRVPHGWRVLRLAEDLVSEFTCVPVRETTTGMPM